MGYRRGTPKLLTPKLLSSSTARAFATTLVMPPPTGKRSPRLNAAASAVDRSFGTSCAPRSAGPPLRQVPQGFVPFGAPDDAGYEEENPGEALLLSSCAPRLHLLQEWKRWLLLVNLTSVPLEVKRRSARPNGSSILMLCGRSTDQVYQG